MAHLPEKDWKIIRLMKGGALDYASRRIIDKALKIIEDRDKSAHAKYLDLYTMIKTEDKLIAQMFNDLKRSTALLQLVLWKRHDLITEEQFKSLSKETQECINLILKN